MTINELRVGNYVFDDYSGICVISEIHEKTVLMRHTAFSINGKFDIDKINPVPLNEKWLVKFGFMQNSNHWTNLIIDLDYITQENYFEYEIQFPFLDWVKRDLKYVHQLQNLYFALTGEELTIKQQ